MNGINILTETFSQKNFFFFSCLSLALCNSFFFFNTQHEQQTEEYHILWCIVSLQFNTNATTKPTSQLLVNCMKHKKKKKS